MSATAVNARRFVSLVKLEHTVFALPFAFVGAILAVDGIPSLSQVVWVTLAMVGARSLAMALNRLIDAEIDARNPRTKAREIPAGLLSRGQVVAFCVGALVLFLIAVWQLDPVVRWLWPIPVALFVVYPYTKRFTWLCHLVLGLLDRPGAAGRLAGRGRRAALGAVHDRRRGRAVDRRLRHHLCHHRRRLRPAGGPVLAAVAVRHRPAR